MNARELIMLFLNLHRYQRHTVAEIQMATGCRKSVIIDVLARSITQGIIIEYLRDSSTGWYYTQLPHGVCDKDFVHTFQKVG